jgi:hypothetical protein
MCTATATATAASRSAQDWRKQSHADGRDAEHDAQSLCDHCRPPFAGRDWLIVDLLLSNRDERRRQICGDHLQICQRH